MNLSVSLSQTRPSCGSQQDASDSEADAGCRNPGSGIAQR